MPFTMTGPVRRGAALITASAAALLASACGGGGQPTPSGSGSPSAFPFPSPSTADIDLLHLADEPDPPPDHLDAGAHGLTQEWHDPNRQYVVDVPPGSVTVDAAQPVFDLGSYSAPVQREAATPGADGDRMEVDELAVPDLAGNVSTSDLQRRVIAWESQRLPGPSLAGQRSGSFRGLPAICFKLQAATGDRWLKVLALQVGRTLYILADTGTDSPPVDFDAFAVSFRLLTDNSPQPTPTLPPPPTSGSGSPPPTTGSGSPSPGGSPTPGGQSPTPGPGGQSPTPGGGNQGGSPGPTDNGSPPPI